MENFTQTIEKSPLFSGIKLEGLSEMLSCLECETVNYKKNEIILLAGAKPESVGIVLSGQIHIVRDDLDGNRTILAALVPGDMFAEAMCCAGVNESPVSVLSDSDSTALMLKFKRILHICPNSCEFHHNLIENMLGIIAKKNLFMQKRIEVLCTKSVREKILVYLRSFAEKHGGEIIIPLNREQMANYLCVERSALSHELMRMKNDGIIEYRKNTFRLLS